MCVSERERERDKKVNERKIQAEQRKGGNAYFGRK